MVDLSVIQGCSSPRRPEHDNKRLKQVAQGEKSLLAEQLRT